LAYKLKSQATKGVEVRTEGKKNDQVFT